MVDRVKYFLLAALFLIVAGVIAYDSWNSGGPEHASSEANVDERLRAEVDSGGVPHIDPGKLQVEPKETGKQEPKIIKNGTPVGRGFPYDDTKKTPVKPKPKPEKKKLTPRRPDSIHVVRSGESLEKIALRYYNSRKGIAWIVDANGLRDANTIYANQHLIIPTKDGAGAAPRKRTNNAGAKTTAKGKKSPAQRTYKVKEKDGDLYAICRRIYGSKALGSRVARIMELNKIYSAAVKTGTVLSLPSK